MERSIWNKILMESTLCKQWYIVRGWTGDIPHMEKHLSKDLKTRMNNRAWSGRFVFGNTNKGLSKSVF